MTEQIIKVLKDNSSFLDRSRSEQGIHEDNFEYIAKEIKKAISVTQCCKSDSEQLCACCDKPFVNDICSECENEIAEMQGR